MHLIILFFLGKYLHFSDFGLNFVKSLIKHVPFKWLNINNLYIFQFFKKKLRKKFKKYFQKILKIQKCCFTLGHERLTCYPK